MRSAYEGIAKLQYLPLALEGQTGKAHSMTHEPAGFPRHRFRPRSSVARYRSAKDRAL
jgi:hypothetical protein